MGWNEPPGGNKGKDPWGNRGKDDGPPDLDEIVKKMQEGIGGIFGKKPGRVGGGGGGGSPLIWLLVIILGLGYLVYDITYFVDQQERGVVMRFGKYVKTMQPGLNIAMPSVIDTVEQINVGQIRSINHRATMLTKDENIVDVEVAVQWQIAEPTRYLFNVVAPATTLRQVAESAIRSVIGRSELDFVLTEGRSEIAQRQNQLMQKILDDYEAGILVVGVEMQPAKPPDEVKEAFDDAIKAREDEQRQINEAEAYRNEIIPRARGEAARIREQANGYRARVVAGAEGQASRFEQLLTEYEQAPAITRDRLYIESIESVLSNSSKVLIDSDSNNSLMYLPIDKILEQSGRVRTHNAPGDSSSGSSGGSSSSSSGSGGNQRDNRSRGIR
ncbi:MAG: FtsH protease activity modulator HflK [Gammaproteobacteria bacterium]